MFLFLLVICIFNDVFGNLPTVKVKEGEILGTTYTLPNGDAVNAFFGVPYAAPPIADFRFKEPQPLNPWLGIWNASLPPSECLQLQHNKLYLISGEEDCLYLNIYTPKLPVKGVNPLLNVLVYFHGGAFMFGTGTKYYPDYILQNDDIVFVTINYRVGVLGFFSTGDNTAPGNYGLKDQVAALKWIKNNIIHFGGNPDGVTIAGCSAGGASVHYHYISPLSEGLFEKGISLSGSVLLPWTLPKNVSQKSTHLAVLVGCPINSTPDMVKCLQKRPAKQLVQASKHFMIWRYSPFTVFGPVVEPESPNAFLSSQPIELLKNGNVKDLLWMATLVDKEGLYPASEFIHSDEFLNQLNDQWNIIAPHLLMYNHSAPETEKDKISSAIRKFYFKGKKINKETINELVQMLGDRLFFNDIIEAIKLHNSVTKSNIYCYKFNYRGKYSMTNIYARNKENYGVSHADDLAYFLSSWGESSQETESDAAVTKFTSSIVINFMRTGNPNNSKLSWPPLPKDNTVNVNCLNIYSSNDMKIEDVYNPTVSEFWKTVLPWESEEAVFTRDEL